MAGESHKFRRIGPYTILRRLGAGGMGEVFLGRTPAGRAVAVKVVKRAFAEDAQFRDRFRREVAAARSVDGAFTAPVVDADPDAAEPWLATEFLPGPSLREAVAAHGPLPAGAVLALAAGLAEALVSIQRAGVVHRDLKPSNVILAPDGPRVIDFGIAHAAEAARVTRTGQVIGTPGFMPPEQAAGLETGPAGDVFALGATLVYAATGNSPYGEAGPAARIYRNVWEEPRFDQVEDARLRDLVADCMKRDPAARPAPDQLLRRLSAPPAGTGWLPGTVAADIAGRAEDTRVLLRRRRRGPVVVLAVAGLVVLAMTGTAVLHFLKGGGSGCDSRCRRDYASERAFAKEWDGRLGSLSNCSTEAGSCSNIVGMAHDLETAIEVRPDSERYEKALEEASRLEQAGLDYGAFCTPGGLPAAPLPCDRAIGEVRIAGTGVLGELHAVPTRTFTGS
ncbi:serine/threonine protein kinase [Mycobacterium tuberculosis]|nr:serine/threonine protein kinase [Mycobacterium tuberculosis]